MKQMKTGSRVLLILATMGSVLGAGILLPGAGLSTGAAWAAPESVDEAKVKSLEALEAIARALQDFAAKAKAEAQGAAERARESLQTTVDQACDTALHACQKVCGDDAKCLSACKEGRHKCQP
jgi:hypothetical protein